MSQKTSIFASPRPASSSSLRASTKSPRKVAEDIPDLLAHSSAERPEPCRWKSLETWCDTLKTLAELRNEGAHSYGCQPDRGAFHNHHFNSESYWKRLSKIVVLLEEDAKDLEECLYRTKRKLQELHVTVPPPPPKGKKPWEIEVPLKTKSQRLRDRAQILVRIAPTRAIHIRAKWIAEKTEVWVLLGSGKEWIRQESIS
ncbi:hypothetical protein BCR34DRAFT_599463 [Clohesyomyces aquaticus]|uniref:Uncharacterized protein n=1 Tax=Clohesyomyces aquaticus TaxID=1231657 RepID=A0A1Y1ZUZ8_9PLEO|nr:hypothetical protein BCR34DRAFT_599463 [Clohesyomyces aquaticus]